MASTVSSGTDMSALHVYSAVSPRTSSRTCVEKRGGQQQHTWERQKETFTNKTKNRRQGRARNGRICTSTYAKHKGRPQTTVLWPLWNTLIVWMAEEARAPPSYSVSMPNPKHAAQGPVSARKTVTQLFLLLSYNTQNGHTACSTFIFRGNECALFCDHGPPRTFLDKRELVYCEKQQQTTLFARPRLRYGCHACMHCRA